VKYDYADTLRLLHFLTRRSSRAAAADECGVENFGTGEVVPSWFRVCSNWVFESVWLSGMLIGCLIGFRINDRDGQGHDVAGEARAFSGTDVVLSSPHPYRHPYQAATHFGLREGVPKACFGWPSDGASRDVHDIDLAEQGVDAVTLEVYCGGMS